MYIKYVFVILLLSPFLYAQETPEKVKKPARESYREVVESWQNSENSKMPKGITGQYHKITVSPKTFPDPLLRYRVNVLSTEKESGNAYPFYVEAFAEFNKVYHRAMQQCFQSKEYRELNPATDGQKITVLKFKHFPLYPHWNKECYTVISPEDEARLYADLENVYQLLEKASRKRHDDWSETHEFKGIATDLSYIQDSRALARYLQGKADWEIRNGKYEDAVKTIRTGLVLGEHIQNSSPSSGLVAMLVGIALTGMMQHQLLNLAAQPDAPNLYPTLTQLRLPTQSLLDAMCAEQLYLFPHFVHPDIYDKIDTAAPEECKAALENMLVGFLTFTPMESAWFGRSEQGKALVLSGICVTSYPAAKQRLLKRGLNEEQIDQLSTYQIVAPFILEEIKKVYDLMFVTIALPEGESHTDIVFNDDLLMRYSNPAEILVALLFPATQAAKTAFLRQSQTLDRIKIVEAVRYYAAVHDGQLPKSLDDIKEIPVPKIDPVTGRSYVYRVEGNTAVLDYTTHAPSRMEIVLEP